ncbi:MAG: hypothetical protein GTO45_31405, partial [Candidatus Aminicenantes bacterium]|nr:hypothetical protein [Candidatus Aminicenantes bacterium]NIM83316.1 hypothetical protein [Candidatus Aminicenantes bacterium]NIN22675.1 hypothetical protein [Candidatus Aminicenantes bacterium]NIN46435.1 hypothetical protein [Candidatus Aminicenantes bacterium]NIN89287.1 hypothetical protein [Candidatus Aminicenantes bacterium]
PYYLEVKGFQRYSFDLYPWIGKKIRISEDLEVSPSILVRVPADSLGMISKGKIVVTAGEKVIAQKETQQDKGALLIGDYTG